LTRRSAGEVESDVPAGHNATTPTTASTAHVATAIHSDRSMRAVGCHDGAS
jgi:hypothetical protein